MCSLEKIDEERQIMLQRLRRVEDDVASLEAAKNEAEQFLAKDAEIQRLLITECDCRLTGLRVLWGVVLLI